MNLSYVSLLSGGLDSAANLALAARTRSVKLALTIAYGQPAEEREILAASRLAEVYGVPHQVLKLDLFKHLKPMSVPDMESNQLNDTEKTQASALQVWIPNRNGIFIQVAAGFAETNGFSAVLVGFNREEAMTFPDNSVGFMEASSRALEFSTRNRVEVKSFTARMDKPEIVRELRKLSDPRFPFDLLWSCYRGMNTPCLKCESCLRLERAMRS